MRKNANAVTPSKAAFAEGGWPREPGRGLLDAPCLMDCGLLLCASRAPDASGFEPFDWRGNDESPAQKGMQWADFGGLVVVATHMTFVYADGGAQRAAQQAQLARLVARLLLADEGGDSGRRARSAILVGDFNSALAHQVLKGAANGPRPSSATPASVFEGAWLGAHASVERLFEAFAAAGLELRRMDTGAEPTCEDGTVDHVFCAAARGAGGGGGGGYHVVSSSTLPDPKAEFSDHLMVRCELALSD